MRCKHLACAALRSQLTTRLDTACNTVTEAYTGSMCQVAQRVHVQSFDWTTPRPDRSAHPASSKLLGRRILKRVVSSSWNCQAKCLCEQVHPLLAGGKWQGQVSTAPPLFVLWMELSCSRHGVCTNISICVPLWCTALYPFLVTVHSGVRSFAGTSLL